MSPIVGSPLPRLTQVIPMNRISSSLHRSPLRLTAAVVLAGLVSAVVTGAGCEPPPPQADVTYISNAAHMTLDPQTVSWVHDIRVIEQMYEPLLEYDFLAEELVPAAAERWQVSDDGLTYTFHLRDDARWSNGDAVTAEDYIFAWRRAMLPDLASVYTPLMYRIRGARDFFDWRNEQIEQYASIREQARRADQARDEPEVARQLWAMTEQRFRETVGLSAPDDRTLVVELQRPAPYFPLMTTFATFLPVHRASVEPEQALDPASGMLRMSSGYWSDPSRLVTNGPYRLGEHRHGRWLLMRANEHYWDAGSLANASVLERIIEDHSNAMLAYERGRADIWPGLPSGDLAADLVGDERRDDVHTVLQTGTYFYNFNSNATLPDGRDNPLADARVRRALSKAIDRRQIVNRITRLDQPVARSYVPPDVVPGYDPPIEHGVSFDPERARELLAEAGYASGRELAGLSILFNTEGEHQPVAEAIRAMWREHLGVNVGLEGVSIGHFNDRKDNQDYTICRASWIGSYPDPTYWLDRKRTGDSGNETGWANERYDELLAAADEQQDPSARMALLREAEAILLDEQPMAMIFQYVGVNLWDPERVEGVELNAWMRWRFEGVSVRR